MDSKKWILPLPPNADKMHSICVSPIVLKDARNFGKRAASKMEEEKNVLAKENERVVRPVKKVKKQQADVGLLRGRPILQDVVNGAK